jgi:hypothetical protein
VRTAVITGEDREGKATASGDAHAAACAETTTASVTTREDGSDGSMKKARIQRAVYRETPFTGATRP